MTVNVFFDLDMTLAYRILMWTDTVRELLLEECIVVKESDIKPFNIGNGYPWNMPELSHKEFFKGKSFWEHIEDYMIEGLLERDICSYEVARRVADKFRDRYLDIAYWRIFPDTIPAIRAIRSRGYGVHLISNHVPECKQLLDALHLTELFDSITLSPEVGYEKPNHKIFEHALIGHEGEFNIMIGDNYNADIVGGLGANMHPILVRKRNKNGYRYYAPNLKDIVAKIDEVIENETR